MKYNPVYTLENLRSVVSQATEAEYSAGMQWYTVARRISHETAAQTGLTPSTVAGCLSALSPRNKWAANVKNAIDVCAAVAAGRDAWLVKCSTFNANKSKAIWIARKNDYRGILKGQKVESFIHNIVHEDSECITVDSHAFNAVCGEILISGGTGPTITETRYAEVSALYHELAAEMGIRGYQAQAIVWVVWKRVVGR